jgi:hypothetical protein
MTVMVAPAVVMAAFPAAMPATVMTDHDPLVTVMAVAIIADAKCDVLRQSWGYSRNRRNGGDNQCQFPHFKSPLSVSLDNPVV